MFGHGGLCRLDMDLAFDLELVVQPAMSRPCLRMVENFRFTPDMFLRQEHPNGLGLAKIFWARRRDSELHAGMQAPAVMLEVWLR